MRRHTLLVSINMNTNGFAIILGFKRGLCRVFCIHAQKLVVNWKYVVRTFCDTTTSYVIVVFRLFCFDWGMCVISISMLVIIPMRGLYRLLWCTMQSMKRLTVSQKKQSLCQPPIIVFVCFLESSIGAITSVWISLVII